MARKDKKSIVFVVIILALVLYILFDKGVFANIKSLVDKKEDKVFVFNEEESEAEKEILVTEEKPPNTVSENTESCEVKILKEATDKNINYVKESVLVSFLADVSFSEAKSTVVDLGYSIRDESSAKARFDSGHKWFAVKVGKSKEFGAICILREQAEVKNAILEPVFELHE